MSESEHQTGRYVLSLDESQGITMAFRRIPAGEFLMGARGYLANEEPVHRVVISRDFWLGETPVTQAQFAVWTGSEAYARWFEENLGNVGGNKEPHRNHFGGDPERLPAESLSWHEAAAYCDWSGKWRGLPAGHLAALPTEAQWEYACRAGTETEYYSGDGEAALAEAGWYGGNSAAATHGAGMLRPNEWGLYDMHGNVWEWCRDGWDREAYTKRANGVTDPVTEPERGGDEGQTLRVLRGGSCLDSARHCRSAWRRRVRAAYRDWNFGLRVCLFPSPERPETQSCKS